MAKNILWGTQDAGLAYYLHAVHTLGHPRCLSGLFPLCPTYNMAPKNPGVKVLSLMWPWPEAYIRIVDKIEKIEATVSQAWQGCKLLTALLFGDTVWFEWQLLVLFLILLYLFLSIMAKWHKWFRNLHPLSLCITQV